MDCEFIHLAAERWASREAHVVSVRWLSTANQARLFGNEPDMIAFANSPRFSHRHGWRAPPARSKRVFDSCRARPRCGDPNIDVGDAVSPASGRAPLQHVPWLAFLTDKSKETEERRRREKSPCALQFRLEKKHAAERSAIVSLEKRRH